LVLGIVTSAELKRQSGSRPKTGRRSGLGGFNGRPTHGGSLPVSRGALTRSGQRAERGKPDSPSGAGPGVSPRRCPGASPVDSGAGKGGGRKRTLGCQGRDRGARTRAVKYGGRKARPRGSGKGIAQAVASISVCRGSTPRSPGIHGSCRHGGAGAFLPKEDSSPPPVECRKAGGSRR